MTTKRNVLVFPCGSEIGLEVNRALRHSTYFTLWGGSSVDDHGRFVFCNYIGGLPNVDDADFIGKINAAIRRHAIDYIIPAHDSVVLKLAEHAEEVACPVVTSPLETCRIARSKAETYARLRGVVPIPRIYTPSTVDAYPVFLKPDVGQGSKGCLKVRTAQELAFALQCDPSRLILEYLPGREYTIDCFTDRHRRLLFVGGRQRSRISNGISVNSRIVDDPRFAELARAINDALVFRGAWFFQVKERANGELVLMEIAPRIAGTMELYHGRGVNFAQLSLFDAMGSDVKVEPNRYGIEIDRALASCFRTDIAYESLYVDLDDTLVVEGRVNAELMRLLYQAFNDGKRIILLSRHARAIDDTLQEHAIARSLFSDVIHLTDRAKRKSDFIVPDSPSVFIDDSFAERSDVLNRCRIPVFAPDAVDVLIDQRN